MNRLTTAVVLFWALAALAQQGPKVSDLPRATNVQRTDLFLMNTNGAGSPQGTRMVKATDVLESLKVITNGQSTPVALNGGGVTNVPAAGIAPGGTLPVLNAVALTNLTLATAVAPGAVDTNQFQMLSVPSMSRRSMTRTPQMIVDLWHNPDGANWSDLTASNIITIASNAGLVSLWGKIYVQFTDGLWGGRTNGHLFTRKPTTQANVHDITNLLKHCSANGVDGIVYSEDGEMTSAGLGAGSGGSDHVDTNGIVIAWTNAITGEQPLIGRGIYIETDVRDWAAMGVRGVQWDVHGPLTMDYRMYMSRRMAAACQSVTKSNAPMILRASSFINYNNTLVGFDPLLPKTALNSWRGSLDSGAGAAIGFPVSTWDTGWAQAVYEFAFFSRYNYTVEPGGNYYFDSPSLGAITQGQQQTNQTIGTWAMWAMACSDISTPALYDASSPAQYRFLTNRWYIAIHQDPLVIPAHCVTSNTDWSVWARPLIDGSQAVMLLNHKTNNNTGQNISVNWTNLGFSPNDVAQVRDVLGDSNLLGMCEVVTNSAIGYNRNVGYESAALLIVSRSSPAPQFNTDGTVRIWPEHHDFSLKSIPAIWSPDAINVGVEGTGPAPVNYEPVLFLPGDHKVRLDFTPPRWATNAVFVYGVQAAAVTSYWTNTLQEFWYSDLASRNFGPAFQFQAPGGNATVAFLTNSVPLTTNFPKTLTFEVGQATNSTAAKFLWGPMGVTWR